jgi:sterol carrier protein 2
MSNSGSPVYVVGVGMTKFIKPRGQVDYPEMGFEASVKALSDADINYDDVDQGVACYAYGDSTCGQRVFYQFGAPSIAKIKARLANTMTTRNDWYPHLQCQQQLLHR